MEELESQIAKIQLGNFKHTNNYVYATAEKAAGSDAELFMVAELPLLNPAALDPSEKICLAISSALKRTYKRPVTDSSFENAVAQVNEELGKLASLGQTHWVDKLNCIISVKYGRDFSIATCGKVAAFLLRHGEFTDISCSSPASHPLKTFENLAAGKIRLDDLLILSTTQLFNYLSMDRFKNVLTASDFLNATQTIIEILKENAGPEVAFGTLLNLQVPPGQTTEEEIDLENYILEKPIGHQGLWAKALDFAKTILAAKDTKRVPQVGLPKISFSQRLKKIGGNTKSLLGKIQDLFGSLGRKALVGGRHLDLRNFSQFSPWKKFFLFSSVFLLVAVVFTIYVAINVKRNQADQQLAASRLKEAEVLLQKAQSSLLYNDQAALVSYMSDAKNKLGGNSELSDSNKDLYQQISTQLSDLEQKLDKNLEVKVTDLGGIGQADRLIKLPGFIALQIGTQIVSYNKASGKMEDGTLKSSDDIASSMFIGKTSAAVHNGRGLQLWDFTTGKTGSPFFQSVPEIGNLAGLGYYATNNRVYAADKKAGQIVNYLVSGDAFTKPVVAVRDNALTEAVDMAIDGNIYVLTSTDVKKYQAGKPVSFTLPYLSTPLSGSGKIYTEKSFKNLYILDSGNNRILAIDKKGNLISTLKAKEFTKLKDFQVDEAARTIYVLNDGSLLKVTY